MKITLQQDAPAPGNLTVQEVFSYGLRITALCIAYYVSGRWGLQLHAVNRFATPVWAPTGLSLAALLLFGKDLWPGVMLGAYLVNAAQGATLPQALIFAAGNTLEALLGCYLLRRFQFRSSLARLRDVFALVLGAAVFSTMASATLGTLTLVVTRSIPLSFFSSTWKVWWAGDLLSDLIIAPVLLVWGERRLSMRTSSYRRWVEAAVLGGSLLAVADLAFARPFDQTQGKIALLYLVFPPLIGIAFRFGPPGAVTATFITSVWVLMSTLHGLGPFAFQSPNDLFLSLQSFMGVTALTGLVFAAMTAERAEARRQSLESEGRLRQSHEELERSVEERTRALVDANALLRENEERFRLLVEDVEDYAIFGLNPTGHVMTWNAGAERSIGYSAEDILGKHFSVFYTPDDVAAGKPERLLQRAITEGRAKEQGWRVRKDGSRFLTEVVITALRDKAGTLLGFAKITRDITERKQMDDRLKQKDEELFQARKLEAIGRLAGGVAHDFNNLITGILGISQDLKRSFPIDDPRREEIEVIIKASNRAFDVTRQLLAFGRRQIMSPRIIDINVTIADFVKLLHRLIGEDVKLEVQLSENSMITMDPGNLGQVLMNLALNARDAMPLGGTITIRTANVLHPKNGGSSLPHVLLEVLDTGKGMDPETLAHIFEPFFTTKTKDQGTGLGLATVYGIIKQSQGDIVVDSHLGKGASFKIYLPRAFKREEAERIPVKNRSLVEGHDVVLVVEDEDIVRWVVVKRLTQAGYNVLEANNGENALALVEKYGANINLIVTDVVMPAMNGRELVKRVRDRYPDMAVLYMSGYPDDIIAHRGTLEPGINFIEKAAIQQDLLKKVQDVLEMSASKARASAFP